MKKHILILMIICTVIFSVGCQNKADNVNSSEKSQNSIESTENKTNDNKASEDKKTNKISYDIPNDGGNFSSEDLIYFIMTDRFYDGDTSNDNFSDVDKNNPKAFHGGDLKGIIDKLDYIKSIGATAIWITPVVQNEEYGYHGYWANDFYKVDNHLGNMDNLKELVNEAHKKDIKVMIDYVVNHTGYKSPWLNDKNKNDWFHKRLNITNWSDPKQVENGWLAGLPDLNQQNPDVKEYLIKNALWWIDETGIDGMRLDTVRHVQKEFWADFTSAIKEKYPDFYLLGEVWDENSRYCETYHEIGIDSITNYSLFSGIRKTFTRFGKTTSLINALKREKYYTNPEINGIFIDNHDNTRLISTGGEYGKEYLKQALTFIMTYPSIPVVYYGTEIGMEGMSDPDNRRDMEWDNVENNEIMKFYKSLIDLRKSNPAVLSGDFKLLDYDSYFLSYMREDDKDSVIVIMNVQNKEKDVVVNIPNANIQYKDLLTDEIYSPEDSKLELKLKPLEILILVNTVDKITYIKDSAKKTNVIFDESNSKENRKIIATVNEYKIYEDSFKLSKISNNLLSKPLTDEEIMDKLIKDELVYNYAAENGYLIEKDKLESIIDNNKKALEQNDEAKKILKAYIKGLEISEEEYWELSYDVYKRICTMGKFKNSLRKQFIEEKEKNENDKINHNYEKEFNEYYKDFVQNLKDKSVIEIKK